MYLLNETGTAGMDFLGMEIRVKDKSLIDENGKPIINNQGQQVFTQAYFFLVFGVGFNMEMGDYETLNEAQSVFNLIHSKMKNGVQFLAIQDVEREVGIKRG